MHSLRKHRRNVLQRPLTFEETAYTSLKWLYGQAIRENDFQMEHALGLLLMGLKTGITGSLVVAQVEHLKETGRFELFAATLEQMDSEIAADEGIIEMGVRM